VLFWYHRHPKAEQYKKALLEGYQKHFAISDEAYDALDALVLARGLTYLGWAADRPGDETTLFLEAEVLPVVVKLCREFNARQKIGHQTMHTSSNDTELIKRRNRSEEHTSELQSRFDLVCRLLLEKKNRQQE